MSRGGFSGKVAIVTGAAQGIGAAVTRRLVSEGTRVCMVDRDGALLNATASMFGSAVTTVEADVSDPSAIARFVDHTVKTFGRIDMLHNNAGITGRSGPLIDSDLSDLDRLVDVNIKASFLGIKAVVPHMSQRGGSIVNMATLAALRAAPGMGLYGASKAFVVAMTKTLAVELAPKIRVNAVAPGAIETALLRSSNAPLHKPGEPTYDDKLAAMPMKRAGTPEEAANLIVWLLGDESSFVSGSIYQVDGARGA